MRKLDKKAELTTAQIIGLIIILAGFVVILIFFLLVPWTKTIDKEVCHQSVVMRHSANVGDVGAGAVPFKCQTGKICFVFSKSEECTEFSGIKNVNEIKIKDEEDIKKELAGLMYDCWDMLGRGLLDYHPRGKKIGKDAWVEQYCSPCYRVAFSDEVKKEYEKIQYDELYKWMAVNEVPNQEKTFLQAVYYIDEYEVVRQKLLNDAIKKGTSVDKIIINTSQEQVILTSMIKEGWGRAYLGAGIGFGASLVALALVPVSGGASLVIPAFVVSGAVIGSEATEGAEFTPPIIIPYDAVNLQRLECKEFDFIP